MPTPNKDEKKDDFIKRCVPYVIKEGTAKDGSQARAICESIWTKKDDNMTEENTEETYEQFSFDVQLTKTEEKIALKDCEDCEEQYEIKEHRAVALIGDRIYRNAFLPAEELSKAYPLWENTLHDINHQGVMDARGMMVSSNILYFVGYNDNVTYDEVSKSMSMDIHICDNTHYASAWRGYIELCEKSGQTPNVSVSFKAKVKAVKVSDLPDDFNYEAYGLRKNDSIRYIYDMKPDSLSTVFRGACNDKCGCGIGLSQEVNEDVSTDGETPESNETKPQVEIDEKQQKQIEKERAEIISWLKKHEEQ